MLHYDSAAFSNISATTATFALLGGKYMFTAVGTWGGGSATLNILGPDGATYLSVGSAAVLTANGGAVVDLPPGDYQIAIATATAVYATVVRIPEM